MNTSSHPNSVAQFHHLHPPISWIHTPRPIYSAQSQIPALARYGTFGGPYAKRAKMIFDNDEKSHASETTQPHLSYYPQKAPRSDSMGPNALPLIDCHCSACSFQAEVGWSKYVNMDVQQSFPQPSTTNSQTPWQFNGQAIAYGPIQPHVALPMPQDQLYWRRVSEPQYLNEAWRFHTSDTSHPPSLVDPAEVFPRLSPAPTLSDCSTRSLSSEHSMKYIGNRIDDHLIYQANPNYMDDCSDSAVTSSMDADCYNDRLLRGATNDTISQDQQDDVQEMDESEYSSTDSRSVTCSPCLPQPNKRAPRLPSDLVPIQGHSAHRYDTSRRKDDLLVRCKQQGWSYREIKEYGKFKEAESTLRGRYRALTKNKDQRVRKPKWTKLDIKLLQRAVKELSVTPITTAPHSTPGTRHFSRAAVPKAAPKKPARKTVALKTPWKAVAQYIIDNGGSYLFGNATCRKKWDEINRAVVAKCVTKRGDEMHGQDEDGDENDLDTGDDNDDDEDYDNGGAGENASAPRSSYGDTRSTRW